MRVTWKLDPPVCQWTIIIVSVPKMSPKTGSPQCSSSEPLPSGVEGSCRVGCGGCLLSSPCFPVSLRWSQGCTSPLSAGGAARAQVLLFSLLCGGCRGSAGSVLLCVFTAGEHLCVGVHRETGPFMSQGQKPFVPSLVFLVFLLSSPFI